MSRSKPNTLPLALSLALSCLVLPLTPVLAAPAAPMASRQQGAETWTINMKEADIREFIDQIASITGETFVVDPRVKGQVTVISNTPLGMAEVYQLFLSVMSTHGFSVLTQGDQARVVPVSESRSSANSGRRAPDDVETELIQVQHAAVNELIPLIRPLVPQNGHLAAVSSSNALIISDRRANIERIRQLVSDLDSRGGQDYSVINLQNAWVMDAAEALNNSIMRSDKKEGGTRVIADARTNRLILLGPPAARRRLADLARSLDVPSTRSANARVIRLRHSDAKSLAETLGDISEGLKQTESGDAGGAGGGGGKPQNILIRADENLNALVLLADPDTVATLEEIVRNLDVPRAQVMVEAAIVEFAGDIEDALGVQWAVDARGGTGGLGGVSFANTGLSVGTVIQAIQDGSLPENTTLPDGAILGLGTDSFGVLVTALSANSKSNLLSTPSLLTLDNQEAEILVGQNVPFQTGSYTTDSSGSSNPFTTIEREDIGVTLKVTPHINDGATLRLEVEQEISSIAPSAGDAVDLITNKRSIKSAILADDGQVIVLGGLIQDDVTTTASKVPLLGDIPVIGPLFRSTTESHVKRNLMVFLRPTIVRDRAGMAALSGRKYRDISVLGYDDPAEQTLRGDARRLFDKPGEAAVDLRKNAD